MAGPAAGVLLPKSKSHEVETYVADLLRLVSQTPRGDDFWVTDTVPINGGYAGEGRPFLVGTDDPTTVLSEDDAKVLSSLIGWRPIRTLSFAAMCNQAVDHMILAELCLHTASRLQGIVEVSGNLRSLGERAATILKHPEVYSLANNDDQAEHYMSAEALRTWMLDPGFTMIK